MSGAEGKMQIQYINYYRAVKKECLWTWNHLTERSPWKWMFGL